MYILDTNDLKKQTKNYIFFSIFCLIFGIIYECFSFGVYSKFMMFAFLIPLIFGVAITYILNKKNIKINAISNNLYNSSVITFTVYSIIQGILEIYGTTNMLSIIYIASGVLLLIASIITYIMKK